MKAKLFLALATIFAFAASASADSITIINELPANVTSSIAPTGDYFIATGIGSAGGGFFLPGVANSTFDGASEIIGLDFLGTGSIFSSDLFTVNGDGTANLLLTLTGDLLPGGLVDGGGVALTEAALFLGVVDGGLPIDFGGETVLSADVTASAAGTTVIGPADLVALGVDVQSGSFGISLGAATGLGIDEVTLDIAITHSVVPEPTSFATLGILGIGLVTRRRR